MKNYHGILFFGQSTEIAGRGITSQRLRTSARRHNYDVLTVDFVCDINKEEILAIIDNNVSDTTKFLGFSTSWLDFFNAHEFVWMDLDFFRTVKEKYPQLKIITGGHDAWNRPLLMNFSDYHFHGFSDNTFVEFLHMINGADYKLDLTKNKLAGGYFIDSNKTNPIVDPNDIETVFVKEDNFMSYQPVPIEFSRGCIFRCGFCRHPFQGKKYYDSYQRTPENIAQELRRNYDLFGTTRYSVMDDTFNDSIEKITRVRRALDIAKIPNFEMVAYIKPELLVTKPEMINMLADIGLRSAFIGIESFKPLSRKAIGKGTDIDRVLDACHRLATVRSSKPVLIHANFIVGLPEESREEILTTHEFLMTNRDNIFRSWYWYPLYVRNDDSTPEDSLSIFDKNFDDYGYTIPKNSGQWSNQYFTHVTANQLAEWLNNQGWQVRKYGGWHVSGGWHVNKTDWELENNLLRYENLKDQVKLQARQRAEYELKMLLE